MGWWSWVLLPCGYPPLEREREMLCVCVCVCVCGGCVCYYSCVSIIIFFDSTAAIFEVNSKVACNFLQFAISTSKPPAPVALEGRLCLSGKPHEYKRSLVWLNLPPLANLGIPRAGVATALNLHAPAVTGAPLHPTSPPPKISSLNKKKKKKK